MRGAHFDGGLLIPGRSWAGRAADLRLGSGSATITHRGETVSLEWDDVHPGLSADSWTIGEWSRGPGFGIGVGVHVAGAYVLRTAAMRRETRSPWRVAMKVFDEFVAVPLYPVTVGRAGNTADVDLMQVLCGVLADRPDLRQRLDDRACVERLIADITTTPHGSRPLRTGARRRTMEVLTSMHALRFEHGSGGRPLPDETSLDTDEITKRVLAHVQASRFAQGLDISADYVRDIVVGSYTDVAPWPLRALYD